MSTQSTRGRKFLPDILTDSEVQLLLKCCHPRYPTGSRNLAMIATLYRSGIRVSEALGLVPKDVVVARGELRVHWAKGGQSRVVGMDMGAFELLSRWLAVRRGLGVPASAPVFCTLQGAPLSTSYVRQLLIRLGKKAKITKRVHAHAFRHTFASQLLSEGMDVGVISKQLGHKSIATTARYLDHISPQRVVGLVNAREWGFQKGKLS